MFKAFFVEPGKKEIKDMKNILILIGYILSILFIAGLSFIYSIWEWPKYAPWFFIYVLLVAFFLKVLLWIVSLKYRAITVEILLLALDFIILFPISYEIFPDLFDMDLTEVLTTLLIIAILLSCLLLYWRGRLKKYLV